jgi:hypothetical protein
MMTMFSKLILQTTYYFHLLEQDHRVSGKNTVKFRVVKEYSPCCPLGKCDLSVLSSPACVYFSGGRVFGVVFGLLLMLGLIGLIVYCCCCKNRGNATTKGEEKIQNKAQGF